MKNWFRNTAAWPLLGWELWRWYLSSRKLREAHSQNAAIRNYWRDQVERTISVSKLGQAETSRHDGWIGGDTSHCVHWYDYNDSQCCRCGSNTTEETCKPTP